jgi:hypothetical protein
MDGQSSEPVIGADIERLQEQLEKMFVRAKAAATERCDENEDGQGGMLVWGK